MKEKKSRRGRAYVDQPAKPTKQTSVQLFEPGRVMARKERRVDMTRRISKARTHSTAGRNLSNAAGDIPARHVTIIMGATV